MVKFIDGYHFCQAPYTKNKKATTRSNFFNCKMQRLESARLLIALCSTTWLLSAVPTLMVSPTLFVLTPVALQFALVAIVDLIDTAFNLNFMHVRRGGKDALTGLMYAWAAVRLYSWAGWCRNDGAWSDLILATDAPWNTVVVNQCAASNFAAMGATTAALLSAHLALSAFTRAK